MQRHGSWYIMRFLKPENLQYQEKNTLSQRQEEGF